MRVLLVGMNAEESNAVSASIANLVEETVIETDWAELEQAVAEHRPDVVTVRLGSRPGTVLALMRKVRALYPAISYIALIEEETAGIAQSVAEAGCTDMVLLNELPRDLRRALRVVKSRDKGPGAEGDATVILGAKGGVGTSMVAANLASELAAQGRKRVVLVDLHLFMGDLAITLDLRPHPSSTWFLRQGSMADARTWSEAPPQHKCGFRMLGLTGDLADSEPVTAEQVVFLVDRLKSRYDHVVLDVGSEINEVSLAASTAADSTFIVLVDDLACRSGARRRLQALHALETSAKLVLNRATGVGASEIKQVEDFVGASVAHTLHNDYATLVKALERGQVLRELAPRAALTQDFQRFAELLTGVEREQEKRKKTFFNFFR